MRFLIALVFCALPLGALSQIYPDHTSVTVNDFAGLLDRNAEKTLRNKLNALHLETGIEMAVLTLSTQRDFAPDLSMEHFATGVFNHWGIGNAKRNDGILVMVLHQDRAMRIELGKGFAQDWDRVAQDVIDTAFLPEFQQNRYQQGILEGVDATIQRIARPFTAGQPAPDKTSDPIDWGQYLFSSVLGLFFLRKPLNRLSYRVRRCPQCGTRGLDFDTKVLKHATRQKKGSGKYNVRCPNCSYHKSWAYAISRLSSSSSSSSRSFGGGSSGGGGASGRW